MKLSEIPKALKEEMKEQGLSATDLAARLGCTSTNVHQHFQARWAMRIDTAEKILSALGKTWDVRIVDIESEKTEISVSPEDAPAEPPSVTAPILDLALVEEAFHAMWRYFWHRWVDSREASR